MQTRPAAARLLEWQVAMGADEAIGENPRARFMPAAAAKANPPPRSAPASGAANVRPGAAMPPPAPAPQSALLASARQLADSAGDLGELRSIGDVRGKNAYISNILFWRPPGNRKPTAEETALCLPFVWRHIALARPKLVVLCGGTATAALLGRSEGITRLRGRWFELPVPGLPEPLPATAIYHPSFLLRAPANKVESWRDMLSIQTKLVKLQ